MSQEAVARRYARALFELGKEGAAATPAGGKGVPGWVWIAVAAGVAVAVFLALR